MDAGETLHLVSVLGDAERGGVALVSNGTALNVSTRANAVFEISEVELRLEPWSQLGVDNQTRVSVGQRPASNDRDAICTSPLVF